MAFVYLQTYWHIARLWPTSEYRGDKAGGVMIMLIVMVMMIDEYVMMDTCMNIEAV